MTLSPERLQEIRELAEHRAWPESMRYREALADLLVYADAEHARAEKAERERAEEARVSMQQAVKLGESKLLADSWERVARKLAEALGKVGVLLPLGGFPRERANEALAGFRALTEQTK